MSFGVQPQTVLLNELALFSPETEETQQQEAYATTSSHTGNLKTVTKQYVFNLSQKASDAQKHSEISQNFFKSLSSHKEMLFSRPTLMSLAASSYPSLHNGKKVAIDSKNNENAFQLNKESSSLASQKQTSQAKTSEGKVKTDVQAPQLNQPPHSANRKEASPLRPTQKTEQRKELKESKKEEAHPSLERRLWKKEESKKWWEMRYHQREREGGQNNKDQRHQQEREEEKLKVAKSTSINAQCGPSLESIHKNESLVRKPLLEAPKMGVFALYYILTKMGILSDGVSNFSYKKEIELIDSETTETHKKRLEELKEAIKKEKETANWGIAVKVFSWIGSILAIISGCILIATGVGAVAGAMLIAGGLIQVTSQIMDLAGGWKKIVALLPGEDTEKKRAIVSWMQIGIAVLCLVLSGAGIIWGGFSNFGQASQTAMALIGGIAAMGQGASTIGEGMSHFMFKNRLAEAKRYDTQLAQLKHKRQDLMEMVEWGIDRLEQLFEDISHALQFEIELFQADQLFYRR